MLIKRTIDTARPERSMMAVAKKQDQIFRAADQREIDARWTREAEDRIDAYDRGEIAAYPIDEVFSSLQSRRKR